MAMIDARFQTFFALNLWNSRSLLSKVLSSVVVFVFFSLKLLPVEYQVFQVSQDNGKIVSNYNTLRIRERHLKHVLLFPIGETVQIK